MYGDMFFGSICIIFGLIIILSAIILFKKYKTTISPLNPSNATKLIVHGIYKFSRKPYVFGFIISFYLELVLYKNPIGGLLFVLLFILYLNHFQIIPEESAMLDLFKDDFLKYKENVRRWI
ncbi:MAG: methyltransferase family protein [Candidatus Neomarinimicrobiota bacterium]